MKIKHWDEESQAWVIDGASNASNLELSNAGFVDAEGNSVSIDHGFTKVDNRLTKVEQNLAWVYLNGAKGGGGGGGGETDVTYTITIAEGTTVYTATSSTTINITINSGTIKKAFTLTAKNLSTNEIVGTWKVYSLTRTPITLSNLSGTTEIELSAYDSSANYTTPAYINVVAGAISLAIQTIPPKTIYIGGVASVTSNFTVTNNIAGSAAAFVMTCNGIEVASETGITTTIRSLSYNLRAIIFDSGLFTPTVGVRYTFSAVASTILNSAVISSNVITFDLTVADSNNLIIVTDGITEFIPSQTPGQTYDDLSTFSQGSQLGFTYYLSYARTIHSTFNIDFTVSLIDGVTVTQLDSGRISNVTKGVDNRFVYSTVNLNVNTPGQYIKITLSGSAVNDPGDISAQYTKNVYCVLTEAVEVDLYANNDQETLLAYFSKISGFPNTSIGTWTYTPATSGIFKYSGAFKNSFPQGVKLTLNDVNGVTSGFLTDTDGINSIPGIKLQGGSYGYIQVAEQMFPKVEITSGESFFQPVGFHISTTFKAEESSDADEVILSMGKYADGLLSTGIEISLEQVYVKIGSADSIVCKLPQNELLTVDLDVSYVSGAWYFKVYLNGVLSAVSRVLTNDIDWQFGTDLYLGCRYNGSAIVNGIRNTGTKTNFSGVTIYDLKLYTSSQTDFAIVQNYISATEQSSLLLGQIDPTLDATLRAKNLFDSAGNCIIWDRNANGGVGAYLEGNALYQAFYDQVGVSTPYPLLLIEETSASSTLFEAYSTAIFSSSDKETIMGAQFPVKITYTDITGRADILTPTGVNSANGVRVGLQGTSSLSYNAKNYEIYMGDKDEAGNKLLFQPRTDWLPENEFTLKADVMDSAHVNNVVIGKIINGTVSQSLSSPFADTPPMLLPTNEVPAAIRDKIKHTSEGFPCLLFIRFAPDAQGNVQQIKFGGIYNFNLGRYAYYNLGLKILNSFTPVTLDGPTLVTEYTETETRWNTGVGEGVYSLEINQNSSAQGAFQQDDLQIIKFMGDMIYSSRDEESGYTKAKSFYTQMANMALSRIPKYTMDDAGQTPTKPIASVSASEWTQGTPYGLNVYVYDQNLVYYKSLVSGNNNPLPIVTNQYWEVAGELGYYYNLDKNAYYNFAASDNYLNWQNACAYFVIGIVFGMVDSMCKNLTMRNWGSNVWYPAFYDMDTAFGLNNAGQDVVAYFAHLHRWYNIKTADTGISTYTQEKNYISSQEFKQYYASWWNRLWEILENLPITDSGNVGNRTSIEQTYINLRTNLFPDPEAFIEDNYKSYTDTTGSLIFNYDYRIKYLKIAQTYDVNTGEYSDSTDFSQLKFLHGNRVMHVKDWFKKRILFLDGIYGIEANTITIPTNIESPITSLWAANKATGSALGTKFGVTMAGSSRFLYHYSHDSTWGSFWLSENPEVMVVPIPAGETIVSMYANKYITQFTNFKGYPWTGLNNINFPLLEELDLTGLTNMPSNDFFYGGVFSSNGIGLKNVKRLILKNVVLTGPNASAYTLDLSNCSKIEYLDISSSSITNVTLPTSAVLKTYNLSNTAITNLTLSNQAFLETLLIDNCDSLTSITIENCAKLSSLNIPKNVTSVTLRNCATLESISIPYVSQNNSISSLVRVTIDNCPGLKLFSLAGQNNPALVAELAGAWNLETLNLSDTKITDNNLTLASSLIWNTLKSLNISRTNLTTLKFTNITYDYLNLSMFPDLDNILASECKLLTKVKCANNPLNPINLQALSFTTCSALIRVIGHYNIKGTEVFKGCSSLILNVSDVYDSQGTTQFLVDEAPNEVTNISFDPTIINLLGCFEGCSSLTYNDFKLVMPKIGSTVTSIEAMFKGCSGINGTIWYDLFRNCRNLTIIKEAFSGVQLTGAFYSRTDDYVFGNEATYGILDFLPNLLDAEGSFEGTDLTWIDNKVFAPSLQNAVLVYSPIAKVDRMFRNCANLTSCVSSRSISPVAGPLNSEDFFLNLRNLISTYPKEVFSGCQHITMTVAEDVNGNTLLFHVLEAPLGSIILNNSLYSGIKLIGEIKENVFGGISKTIPGTTTYYIPTFSSIQYPFNTTTYTTETTQLSVVLSQMGNMFNSMGSTLLQAIGIFTGVKCATNDSIPSDIFAGCVVLNNIELFFNGLEINNNGLSYDFPPAGMFDDCVELKTTTGLFSGCNKLKIRLVGEGFKNCKLTTVSRMFQNSGLYGTIPYRLFFMQIDNGNGTYSIRKTITDMTDIFKGCWCLGYDINRVVDIGTIITIIPERRTIWEDRIIATEGTPVSFMLDVSAMQKTYNFETGATTFDSWYLDGYGWAGATAANAGEQGELDALKTSLNTPYFNYDTTQATVIAQHTANNRYVLSHQNYMIPTDLFRYCSKNCTLSGVLSNLNWSKQVLIDNEQTGDRTIEVGFDEAGARIYEGLTGRIPVRLFESLTETTKFTDVFKNTRFDAFVGLQGTTFTRGIMYPPDLLKYNIALTDISGMFMGTVIPVGVDINNDIFLTNVELRNVSNVWSDCLFDNRPYNAESFDPSQLIYPQINYPNLFDANTKITNASGLFAVYTSGRGLFIIESTLLNKAFNMNNISNMFYYNANMKGSVPEFTAATYPILNNVTGYLTGCIEGNITNAGNLESRLLPADWL